MLKLVALALFMAVFCDSLTTISAEDGKVVVLPAEMDDSFDASKAGADGKGFEIDVKFSDDGAKFKEAAGDSRPLPGFGGKNPDSNGGNNGLNGK